MEHLIPDSLFAAIESNWILLLIVAFTIAALGKGADWIVEAAASVAYRLGIGKIVVGATIISLGTTTPEAAVSVMAAWNGRADLSLGNAVGSIVCDTALIFGLCVLIAPLPIDRFILNRQGWIQFGSGVLLAALCYGALYFLETPVLGHGVGVAFIALLVAYLWTSIYWSRQHSRAQGTQKSRKAKFDSEVAKHLAFIIAGLIVVLFSSRVLIGSVTELAVRWEVPRAIIAATLVAFGTSLPELVTGLVSVLKGHKELLIGNIVGADILNVLFVVGASALAAPLPIPDIFFKLHLPVMLGVLLLFRIFIAVGDKQFSRWMGIPLLGSYVGYLILQFVIEP